MSQNPSAKRPLDQQADDLLEPIRTLVETATSVQSELLTLWNQRAAAYLGLPRQVSACKSPSDLVEEQIKFLTTMQRNYAEYANAVLRTAKPALEQAERNLASDSQGQRTQSRQQAA